MIMAGSSNPELNPPERDLLEGLRNRELRVQECNDCGNLQFFPRIICTNCGSMNLASRKVAGKGKVYSFCIVTRVVQAPPGLDKYESYLNQRAPYIYAIIELDEGPRICSRIVECPPEEVQIGMHVELGFEMFSPELNLPVFKPVRSNK